MKKSKADNWAQLLLVCFLILASSFHNAEARPHINDVLAKGSQWTLNVDGEEDTLTLLGGKGGKLQKGGFGVIYEVDFGGQKGTLEGVSDAKNSSQRVSIEITRKNGVKVTCHGFVAQETTDFMAGTCGGKVAPGAWYAVRLGAASPAHPSPTLQDKAIKERDQKLRNDLRLALRQRDHAQNRLVGKLNELNRCQKNQTKPQESDKISLQPFSSFKNQVDGTYTDGKFDGAPLLDFPNAPGRNSDAESWFNRLNGGLLHILELGLGSEIDNFRALERDNCDGNIFCKMAYRQQAIYFMLGGN